jgi:hypothetical protein
MYPQAARLQGGIGRHRARARDGGWGVAGEGETPMEERARLDEGERTLPAGPDAITEWGRVGAIMDTPALLAWHVYHYALSTAQEQTAALAA